ncbi:Uncharacterized protein Rs2_33391 [Raphanus sativus]|nr:Uncharacterized protein Rs2_33391 [Raphanus sativus]
MPPRVNMLLIPPNVTPMRRGLYTDNKEEKAELSPEKRVVRIAELINSLGPETPEKLRVHRLPNLPECPCSERELGVPQNLLLNLLISKAKPVCGKERFEEWVKKIVAMGFDPTSKRLNNTSDLVKLKEEGRGRSKERLIMSRE